ncbi:hypothetical protein CGCF415_v001769 [Colletotrichum fructicola]|nr:hypothetical protein CGCFRS4_v007818 [Colletotrichum fructicola]KAF4915108.1 hypothetical protein CGCF415_v001769 [Colletotrichum fructicola]KAF4935796.1 hypothetical protein CGCF245_v007327 [Colletotrichum fructicola]
MRSAHPEGIVVASGANVPLGEPAGPGQMHSGRRRRGHGRGPVDIERQCGVAYPNGQGGGWAVCTIRCLVTRFTGAEMSMRMFI